MSINLPCMIQVRGVYFMEGATLNVVHRTLTAANSTIMMNLTERECIRLCRSAMRNERAEKKREEESYRMVRREAMIRGDISYSE